MKRILSILILLFSCNLNATNDTTASLLNFRINNLHQAFPLDSIGSSSLFAAFEGLSKGHVQEAYLQNRLKVDSLIQADSLSTNFFVSYGLQGIYIFKESKQSQQKAMSLLAPLFAAVMLLVLVPVGIKTFIIGPKLEKAKKPENDPDEQNEDSNEEGSLTEQEDMDALLTIFKKSQKQ